MAVFKLILPLILFSQMSLANETRVEFWNKVLNSEVTNQQGQTVSFASLIFEAEQSDTSAGVINTFVTPSGNTGMIVGGGLSASLFCEKSQDDVQCVVATDNSWKFNSTDEKPPVRFRQMTKVFEDFFGEQYLALDTDEYKTLVTLGEVEIVCIEGSLIPHTLSKYKPSCKFQEL